MTEHLTIGERVAWYRRRSGMSQEVLAGLVGRTENWLQKAERNRIDLDRVSVIRALADALGISLGKLLGEPSLLEPSPNGTEPAVSALQTALMDYRQITSFLTSHIDEEPPPLGQVHREVGAIWSAYQDSRYGYAASRLPLLLTDAQVAARAYVGADRRHAQALLALSYHAAAALMTKLGEADLAWIAADRGLITAQETDDPVIIGSLFRSVVHILQSTGRCSAAVELVHHAASFLRPRITCGPPVYSSVYGTLFLAGSMAAARLNDRDTTRAYLAQADSAAQRLNRDSNHMWTSFGPTNVAIHRVATSMELGDTQRAIELGTKLDTSALPTERRIRHALEVARALIRRNKRDEAFTMLLDAEQIAPEQVRAHFLSRQLALTLIRSHRGRPSPELTGFATRLRVLG